MLTDRYLREVKKGDVVAYPGREGSSTWITTGEVVEVDQLRQRVRLDGGSRGHDSKQLGRRWIRWHRNHLILFEAPAR